MISAVKKLINNLVLKEYPFLYNVKVSREDLGGLYYCKFTSDECLSSEKQIEIDTFVKTLFKMASIVDDRSPLSSPTILCFFDCGKGYEFKSDYKYQHH